VSSGAAVIDAALAAAIVEHSPDAIIVADADGSIRVWNHAAERLFGHVAADVVGQRLDVIIPERMRHAHWEAFDRAIASGHMRYDGRAMTTRSMRRDGTKLYVELSFALITDASGAVTGAMATARDCTERYEAERALRARVAALESGGGTKPA
jgi:PAS domain S-box-containing protein